MIGICIADRMVFDSPDRLVYRIISRMMDRSITDRVVVRRITHRPIVLRIIDIVFRMINGTIARVCYSMMTRISNREDLKIGNRNRRLIPLTHKSVTGRLCKNRKTRTSFVRWNALPWLIGKKGRLSRLRRVMEKKGDLPRLCREMKILHNSLLRYLTPFEDVPASTLDDDVVQACSDESGGSQRATHCL